MHNAIPYYKKKAAIFILINISPAILGNRLFHDLEVRADKLTSQRAVSNNNGLRNRQDPPKLQIASVQGAPGPLVDLLDALCQNPSQAL